MVFFPFQHLENVSQTLASSPLIQSAFSLPYCITASSSQRKQKEKIEREKRTKAEGKKRKERLWRNNFTISNNEEHCSAPLRASFALFPLISRNCLLQLPFPGEWLHKYLHCSDKLHALRHPCSTGTCEGHTSHQSRLHFYITLHQVKTAGFSWTKNGLEANYAMFLPYCFL